MKIVAVVILYYPDESIEKNIGSYLSAVEKLFVIDNSETPSFKISPNIPREKIMYRSDGENKGIAVRLNEAIEMAKTGGFEWLLTMDQDSYFEAEQINDYITCIEGYEGKDIVSMFGVNFEKKSLSLSFCQGDEVMHLITSGSVVNLSANKTIGPFDENLFIDEVDFEYCLRSVQKGFKNVCFENIFLNHQLGKTSDHRSLKNGDKTQRSLHSPTRIYYMVRNFFYINEKYRDVFSIEMKLRKKILLNRLKNNLFYNKKRMRIVINILKGYLDYKKYAFGKRK